MEIETDKQKEVFDGWAKDWKEWQESCTQLSHIRAHPSVNLFADAGPDAIPYMLEKLKTDIFWSLPLEKMLDYEYGVDFSKAITGNLEAALTGDPLQNKFRSLENYRKIIFDWAGENGYLSKDPKEK